VPPAEWILGRVPLVKRLASTSVTSLKSLRFEILNRASIDAETGPIQAACISGLHGTITLLLLLLLLL